MTSNMGAERIQQHAREQGESFEQLKEDMMEIVRHHLRPEFVNRIDEIIVFEALTKDQIVEIARLLLDRTNRRLRAQDIEVEFTEGGRAHRRGGLRPRVRGAPVAPRHSAQGGQQALQYAPEW